MHELIENLPVNMEAPGTKIRALKGWGGMFAVYAELPAGTDFTPLLQGLPNDLCPCPHWGYVLKGSVNIRYSDGSEEVIKAGEVYYWPSGHTGWTEEETAFIEFSPEKEFEEVSEHITKVISEMAQANLTCIGDRAYIHIDKLGKAAKDTQWQLFVSVLQSDNAEVMASAALEMTLAGVTVYRIPVMEVSTGEIEETVEILKV